MSESAGSSVFSNTKWFMAISVVQKIITFALNQIMVVSTSPEVLGQAAVQLELLLSTLLFLSREGIRLAVLRQPVGTKATFQSIVNISWLPPLIVLLFIGLITVAKERFVPEYDFKVVYMYSGAAFVECLGEPLYNMFQNAANIKPRLAAETTAIFTKSVVTVLCVAHFNLGVQGFGIAQLAYSGTYITVLFYHYFSALGSKTTSFTGSALRLDDFLPGRIIASDGSNAMFGAGVVSMAATLTGSSLLKHLLTESDKIALTLSASSYNQGIYAVTNNYGSLAARVIYLPLEDSSRLAFAKLTGDYKASVVALRETASSAGTSCDPSATECSTSSSAITKRDSAEDLQGAAAYQHCQVQLLQLKNTFTRLLRLVGFIGLFFALFGIPYVSVAVRYVLGSKWRSAETVSALSMYCVYLLVMGVNGVAESFVQTAAPADAFRVLNFGLVLSSVGFVAVAIPAVSRMGTSGIILANAFSMVVRIANNTHYTLRMFAMPRLFFDANESEGALVALPSVSKSEMLREFAPPLRWVVTALLSAGMVHASAHWYTHNTQGIKHTAVHVVVGGVVAVMYLVVSLYFAPDGDVAFIVHRLPASIQRRFKKSKQL